MKNKLIILIILLISFISLLSLVDAAMSTCLKTKNNSICQEFDSSICDAQCSSNCVPALINQVQECKQGTCYNSNQGTCQFSAVKFDCESKNSQWFDNIEGNIAECKKGCCFINGKTDFITDKQCSIRSSALGAVKNFKPEINTEIACYEQARVQEEGACTYSDELVNACKFTTRADCIKTNGEFHLGILCSSSELETECTPQATTGCVSGRDEIYWFDSCGNRENIYDFNKKEYLKNLGKVVSKNESCSLGNSNNAFVYQDTCGNCDYAKGSYCGLETSDQKLADPSQRVVCRDLTCRDESGKVRQNGESWCAYQGSVGLDAGEGGFLRNTDAVGGRHFKEICVDGEIRKEPCADYREEICIEAKEKTDSGKQISFAACKENKADECFRYNQNVKGKGKERKASEEKMIKECSENEFCFVKQTSMIFKDETIKKGNVIFCVPKFAEGFELNEQGYESAKDICGLASKTYKFIPTKKAGDYLGQINDLCMSLGDCGAEANIIGSITENYDSVAPKKYRSLSADYLASIKKYSSAIKGRFIIANSNFSIYLNETELIGSAGLSRITGGKAPSVIGGTVATLAGAPFAAKTNQNDAIIGTGLIAAGIVFPPAAIIGGLFLGGVFSDEPKVVKVVFTCSPWEAPLGGNECNKCGKDGLPCSEYSCSSLGKYCKLINENTRNAECISESPNDVVPPKISPLQGVLLEGYSYQNSNDEGVTIKTGGDEGCIGEYEPIILGVNLDEPGKCRYDTSHVGGFDNMTLDFGEGGYYTRNKTQLLFVPNLESMGVSGFEPGRRTDLRVFVRCEDNSGNQNERDYIFNLCIKPQPDTNKPVVLGRDPDIGYVSYNKTEEYIQISVNEPSECKWDISDKRYDEMQNNMSCDNIVSDITNNGWQCDENLPITSETNRFYVRCKDQPWLIESVGDEKAKIAIIEEDEEGQQVTKLIEVNGTRHRNEMIESYSFEIKRSSSNIKIDYIKPDNRTFVSGVEPISLDVEVKTSGGYDGKAKCYYWNGDAYRIFFETDSEIHKQTFTSYYSGEKELTVRCEDIVRNVEEKTAKFKIEIDNSAPMITRVYSSNGFNVITNEESECRYSKSSILGCNFEFVNGTLMDGSKLVHKTSFNINSVYYVKCKDNYNNVNSQCLVVRAIDLTGEV